MEIEKEIRRRILDKYQELNIKGEMVPLQKLNEYYQTFQHKFGPEILVNLDWGTTPQHHT